MLNFIYAEHHTQAALYAEMLSVIMLNVVMLNAVMLNAMVQFQISFFNVNTKHSRGIEAKYMQYWTRFW